MPENAVIDDQVIAKRVAAYIEVRNRRAALKKEWVATDLPFAEMENLLSGVIMAHIKSLGVESARTKSGTCSLSHKAAASLADPDAFMRFVIEHGHFDLLDRKANAKAIEDYINTHDMPPPGVNFNIIQTLRVTAPTLKTKTGDNTHGE